MVTPIWTTIAIHLMISFAVYAFEDVRTWLSFFCSCTIQLLVFHATPCILPVMFSDVSSIALGTPGDMRLTAECHVTPFPTVLALWNTQVHIGTMNGHDESSNIETAVDNVLSCRTNVLSCRTILRVPDIHPNHCHVGFGGSFNNTWF